MTRQRKTLFDKIWDSHIVKSSEGYPDALYIDRHFIHEVTSPQAFDGLRKRNVKVFNPSRTTATADHNVPTIDQHLPIKEALSRHQVDTLRKNCPEFGIELYDLGHPYQGIVHIIGPELGLTLQECVVCGDSHTSTHGALKHSIRYRYKRSRTGSRDTMRTAVSAEDNAHRGQWRVGQRDSSQGYNSLHHFKTFREWRHRVFCGIRRGSHPESFHGGAHDNLQHEH